MEWLKTNQIKVSPPKKPKPISGTRFASILGLDRWNTPFKTWCAITRTYEEPFFENKYTKAGKTIEPKIIDYLNKVYFFGDLKTPKEVLPEKWFECFPNSDIPKHKGNFFPNSAPFGGAWDAVYYDKNHIVAVIEIKTTKRAEDWQNGAPEYYALQAALYAYLLGVDDVIMVVSFLEDKDYEHPEKFVPSAENTMIDEFKISERFPRFQGHIERAMEWWETHIEGGISPVFDEKKDENILKELRKNVIETDNHIANLITEGEKLKIKIEKVKSKIDTDEKRLKQITEALKKHCMGQFRDGDTRVAITGQTYEWILSKFESTEIDKGKLKKDGLLDKYSKPKVSYRFTQPLINKEESE